MAQEAPVAVSVVDEFVPKGADPETIKSAVSVEQVPARLKQDDAITDLGVIGEQVAAADLQVGDQLLAARLASEDVVTTEITDKVQVSALLAAERAVGGAIQQGDLVGVYLSFEPFDVDDSGIDFGADGIDGSTSDIDSSTALAPVESAQTEPANDTQENDEENDGPDNTPNVSRLEFQNVLVTNVQTINPPVTGGDDEDEDSTVEQVTGTQYVVTLALSPEESERFVFATEFGNVWLSLDPATVVDDGTRPVTLGDVFTVVGR